MPDSIIKKRFIIIIIFLIISIITFSPDCTTIAMRDDNIKYIKNNDLVTIKDGYLGNATNDGRFIDDVEKTRLSFFTLLKWKFSTNPQKQEKEDDKFKLIVSKSPGIFDSKDDMLVWLGHSSFFLRIDSKTFLIDSVLSDIPLRERLCDIPFKIEDIKNIDYLLVSHTHYDHLDSNVIKAEGLKNVKALIPLGMGKLIKSMNKDIRAEEAGWYQKYNTDAGPKVFLMPAMHWSKRSLNDTNEVLWGSYIIKGKNKCIYFSGDTAYSEYFKEIQKLFPKIDICIMSIGAYKPAYIMSKNHMSPYEAVSAFNDMKGRILIPMHYGTYDLSDEPPGEPLRLMEEQKLKKQISGRLQILNVGEIFKL